MDYASVAARLTCFAESLSHMFEKRQLPAYQGGTVMSEKKKKNTPQEEQPQADTAPETEQAAEKAAEEETFTVTREQMEQMEQLAKNGQRCQRQVSASGGGIR